MKRALRISQDRWPKESSTEHLIRRVWDQGASVGRHLSGRLASSPAVGVMNSRPRRVEQFPLGVQPVIQIVTVLASARQKQLVGAFRNRLRDWMTSLRG
jgi:hypothetical protein